MKTDLRQTHRHDLKVKMHASRQAAGALFFLTQIPKKKKRISPSHNVKEIPTSEEIYILTFAGKENQDLRKH